MVSMALDSDGFLLDRQSWTPAVAEQLALCLNIRLETDHWHVIECAQEFYNEHQLSPAMRVLIKRLQMSSRAQLASSISLSSLFPEHSWTDPNTQAPGTALTQLPPTHIARGSPAKRIAGIAGLPRPTNCL